MTARHAILCTLALVSCDGGPVDLPPPSADPPGWAGGAPLLAPLQENAVVAVGGEVVVVGGYDAGLLFTDRVEAYDPMLDAWRALAPLPRPVHHANAAAAGDGIVVVGMLGDGFAEDGAVFRYDAAADVWTDGAPMPAARARGASGVAVVDGVVHVVGGLRGSSAVAMHDTYDPANDSWTALPDAPLARDHLGAAALDGLLYVVGGRDGTIGGHVPTLHRWSAGGGWEVLAEMPTSRGGLAATAAWGRLHVLGGEGDTTDPQGVFDEHEAYDPATDAWEVLEPLPTKRHGTGAAFANGRVWVPGGPTSRPSRRGTSTRGGHPSSRSQGM